MKKTMVAIAALAALGLSVPALAQQKAKAPPAPVEIPKGMFPAEQADTQYLARNVILFAKVRDSKGKIIGDVEDLIVSDKNEIVGVVLGTGGFLGAGEKKVAVMLSALKIEEKGGKTTVTLPVATKELLAALPAFKRKVPAKSLLDRIKEKAEEISAKTLETSKDAADKAREEAGPALEKAKDAVSKTYDKAKDAAGQAVEKAKEAVQQKQ